MKHLFLANSINHFSVLAAEQSDGGIKEAVDEVLNPDFVSLFGLKVDPAIFTAIIVSLCIIIFAAVVRIFFIPRFKKQPKGFQLLLETLVTFFDKSSKNAVHKHASFVGPYVFTSAVYIALATLIEMLGFRPAFASINACLAMGFMTFIVINICGFREKKLLRFGRYGKNPFNLLTDISVPFSMSLRLFGSILSGYIISEVLYSSLATSFVLPAAAAVITTILHAFLQGYLFATLTNIFVSEAIE